MSRIRVKKGLLDITEAFALAGDPGRIAALGEEKKALISEDEDQTATIELEKDEEYVLNSTVLAVTTPAVIEGHNATIRDVQFTGLYICSSDVTVRDLNMADMNVGITVDSCGKKISGILIDNCVFRTYENSCISIGSQISGSEIIGVTLNECRFIGKDAMEKETMIGATVPVTVIAGRSESGRKLENCSVKDLKIINCSSQGGHRCTLVVMPAVYQFTEDEERIAGDVRIGRKVDDGGYIRDCLVKDVLVDGCSFSGSWDAALNFLGGQDNTEDNLTDGVTIRNCSIEYGIWGVYFSANEPLAGTCRNNVARNIRINDCVFTEREGGSGEESHAIAFQPGRIDYMDGCSCFGGVIENVLIENNTINPTDRGIYITGADSMLDGLNSCLKGNGIRNVEVRNNSFCGVNDCFTIYGAQLEGRRYDFNIGVPRHDKSWAEAIEDNSVVTCVAEDNFAEDIRIRGNHCIGYRYRYKIAGANALGHGEIRNNRAADITIEDNTFENGEGHILVRGSVTADWVRDYGNTADMSLQR